MKLYAVYSDPFRSCYNRYVHCIPCRWAKLLSRPISNFFFPTFPSDIFQNALEFVFELLKRTTLCFVCLARQDAGEQQEECGLRAVPKNGARQAEAHRRRHQAVAQPHRTAPRLNGRPNGRRRTSLPIKRDIYAFTLKGICCFSLHNKCCNT